jgi:hypothetical protein
VKPDEVYLDVYVSRERQACGTPSGTECFVSIMEKKTTNLKYIIILTQKKMKEEKKKKKVLIVHITVDRCCILL